jgi:hypothetical protein
MSSNRAWVWTGRLAALVAAVIIPACGSTGATGGAQPGIFWNSQATTGAPQGQPTAGWVDPNLGVVGPIGISNIITSADDATYDGYFPSGAGGLLTSKITYILGNLHPLSTDTGATAITSRENQLQGQINGYRQTQLGNVGGGGVNGGIAVGNVQGIILAGHFQGTKSARSHCKHYALFHGGFPAGANAEGDAVQTTGGQANPFGTPAPGNPNGDKGRLGKIGVVAYVPLFTNSSLVFSGAAYSDAGAVFSQLLITAPGVVSAIGWTNFSVGHWRGGPNSYYWNIIFLLNPTPPN